MIKILYFEGRKKPPEKALPAACAWKKRSLSLFRPETLGNDFIFGIEIHDCLALGLNICKLRVLHSAEGKIGHRSGNSDIYSDHTGVRLYFEFPGKPSVLGVNGSAVAVLTLVDNRDCLIQTPGLKDYDNGTEDLGLSESASPA